jgi:hypothetical protein
MKIHPIYGRKEIRRYIVPGSKIKTANNNKQL